MTYLESIILGIVQGLAEFLPISSSGHLALLQHFFGIQADKVLMFTVMMHIGTLVSVFIMYWHDIWELIKELFIMIADLCTGKGLRLSERPVRKLGLMIIVATIPAAVAGLAFNDFFDSLNSNLMFIGFGFLITGFLLFFSEKFSKARNGIEEMNFRNGFFVGILQAIAICPGISRSGSTMVGGLITGLNREFAVRFAFLISIPSILGAAIVEMPSAIKAGTDTSVIGPMIVGVLIAAVCGVIAIKAMIKVVVNKKLKWFSYYVWALGALTILYAAFFM